MRTFKNFLAVLTVFCLAAGTAMAGEPGTALKADAIRVEPFQDAKSIGSLATGDKVDILNRQGGWLQVKSAKGSGWVRMLSIRRGVGQPASAGAAGASGVLGLASGRAGTGSVVATTGIRGLNEEELKAAKFDEIELKKVESFTVTRQEARKFADEVKLASQKLEYLPVPAAAPEAQP